MSRQFSQPTISTIRCPVRLSLFRQPASAGIPSAIYSLLNSTLQRQRWNSRWTIPNKVSVRHNTAVTTNLAFMSYFYNLLKLFRRHNNPLIVRSTPPQNTPNRPDTTRTQNITAFITGLHITIRFIGILTYLLLVTKSSFTKWAPTISEFHGQ